MIAMVNVCVYVFVFVLFINEFIWDILKKLFKNEWKTL